MGWWQPVSMGPGVYWVCPTCEHIRDLGPLEEAACAACGSTLYRLDTMPLGLTIGSVFSGIGGLDLGLERAGVGQVSWFCESDPYCRQVLSRHWPGVPVFDDIRELGSDVPRVDVVAGGFPCQDISTAGKGAGIQGEKSGLFFELIRVALLVRPRFIVLENVPAISSRGLDTVLRTLAESGYDAFWRCFSAGDVGSPQRRLRWWCVAYPSQLGPIAHPGVSGKLDHPPGQVEEEEGLQRRGASGGYGQRSRDVAHADSRGREEQREPQHPRQQSTRRGIADRCHPRGWGDGAMAHADSSEHPKWEKLRRAVSEEQPAAGGTHRTEDATRPTSQPGLGGISPGIPRRLDPHRWPAPPGPQHEWEPPRTRDRRPTDTARLRALGNAVVPQCAEIVGRWVVEMETARRQLSYRNQSTQRNP